MSDPLPSTLVLACPAKVNLVLSVGSPIPPQGYHPLASWMVTVAFSDTLELTPAKATTYDIVFAADAPVPGVVDWPLASDLAVRAHRRVESHVGRPLPLTAVLRKRIPTGAGLGGGSSDAAAMLLGVSRLYGLNLPTATLEALGMTLGSDVGFLVRTLAPAAGRAPGEKGVTGTGGGLVLGLGEVIESLPARPAIHMVLVFPGVGCPTAAVYQALDRLRPASCQPDEMRVRQLAAGSVESATPLFNDLASPAAVVQPALGTLQQAMQAALHQPVHVTGSGSTLFLIASEAEVAQALACRITERWHVATVATCTGG